MRNVASIEPSPDAMQLLTDRSFHEWFHAEWLKRNGPVNGESTYGRIQHRETKQWAEAAWIEAISRVIGEQK